LTSKDIDEFIRCFQPGYSRIPEYKPAHREIIRAPPAQKLNAPKTISHYDRVVGGIHTDPTYEKDETPTGQLLRKITNKYFRGSRTWKYAVFEPSRDDSRHGADNLWDLLSECYIIYHKKNLEGHTEPFVWVAVERRLHDAYNTKYAKKRDGEEIEYAGEETDRYLLDRNSGHVKPKCSLGYDPEAQRRINSEFMTIERLDWYDMVFMKRHPRSGRVEQIMEMLSADKKNKKYDFFPKVREFLRLYIRGGEKAA
jgi:hypothetical protein